MSHGSNVRRVSPTPLRPHIDEMLSDPRTGGTRQERWGGVETTRNISAQQSHCADWLKHSRRCASCYNANTHANVCLTPWGVDKCVNVCCNIAHIIKWRTNDDDDTQVVRAWMWWRNGERVVRIIIIGIILFGPEIEWCFLQLTIRNFERIYHMKTVAKVYVETGRYTKKKKKGKLKTKYERKTHWNLS